MKKENVGYSVMYIKKALSMIRLSNLQYEKTMRIAAQQTRVLRCQGTEFVHLMKIHLPQH